MANEHIWNPTNWSSDSPVVDKQRFGNPIKAGGAEKAAPVDASTDNKTSENVVTKTYHGQGY